MIPHVESSTTSYRPFPECSSTSLHVFFLVRSIEQTFKTSNVVFGDVIFLFQSYFSKVQESNEMEHILSEKSPTTPTHLSTENKSSVLDRWPEDPSAQGIYSPWKFIYRQWRNWTYGYMDVVLRKGAQRTRKGGANLSQKDLYVIPKSMNSSELVAAFLRFKQLDESKETSPRKRLLKILWKIAIPTYIPAGFCELIVVLCGLGLPLLVRELLWVLENNPNKQIIDEGLPYALSIFLLSVLNGLGSNRHRHLALETGIAVRAAIINMIYQHVLNLSPNGKQNLSSGEITNLVAVDTQKLFEVTQDGHLIWALPLSIFLVSFFLYQTLGPSTLVGIVVLIGFVPLIERVTAKMLKARSKRVKYTDQRVEIISNMLQGIKVTKLNNYEKNYESWVTETRIKELKHLRTEMAIWATTLCMTVVSPVIATTTTFITYIYLDDSHMLTASDTFGVLLLFSALRFPINFAGRLIGKAAQALSSLQRIALFLDRPIRNNEKQNLTNSSGSQELNEDHNASVTTKSLVLSGASFRIGSQPILDVFDGVDESNHTQGTTTFTVSEFNFSVSKGEILAVCGPVGSGKSTLMSGILDEAEALERTIVAKHGKVSYVPQTPFILNQTLRDNILFGLPFDRDLYERVLDACCLRPDLEQLGAAGDLTEIGERGVTLSGGQKQRVSLARAVYAQPSVTILDDPFSALDSGTGKMVFERLLSSPDALLRQSAVLLVTHAAHFLSHRSVDRILLLVDGSNRFLGTWEDLVVFETQDDSTKRAVDFIKAHVREDVKHDDEPQEEKDDGKKDSTGTKNRMGRLIQVEEREHGLSSIKTWLLWFQRAGGIRFLFFQVLFMAIDRFIYVANEWFLARWTSAIDEPIQIIGYNFPAQSDGFSAQDEYVKVYVTLLVLMTVAVIIRSEWAVTGGGECKRFCSFEMKFKKGDSIFNFRSSLFKNCVRRYAFFCSSSSGVLL